MTEPTLTLRCPADLLTVIPYVVGYHPTDSLVVLGLDGRRVVFGARFDAPFAGDRAIGEIHDIVRRQRCDAAFLVGYGPPDLIDDPLTRLHLALQGGPLAIREVLRAHDGHYWSYLCRDPDCCPPGGIPYDPQANQVAAAATLAGAVIHRDREAYAAQLDPVDADPRAMALATDRAYQELCRVLAKTDDEQAAADAMLVAGQAALIAAADRVRDGEPLTDDEVAWLSVLLLHHDLRDLGWLRIVRAGDDLLAHRALWMDVMRRCERDLLAAPATLFGFAAWRVGQGALARIAFERALDADPGCGLARRLMYGLDQGMPPDEFDRLAGDQLTPRRGPRRSRRSSSRRVGSPPA
jgi:uncharacterized protein DUF4192